MKQVIWKSKSLKAFARLRGKDATHLLLSILVLNEIVVATERILIVSISQSII